MQTMVGSTMSHCDCALCRGVSTANQRYGYDESKVKDVYCLVCHEKIGTEGYAEVPMLARFGQMFFTHKRCAAIAGVEA